MIRAIPPRRVLRSWVCVYCSAHGPADSEAETIRLTRAHLETCRVRRSYMARIDRARKAMEGAS